MGTDQDDVPWTAPPLRWLPSQPYLAAEGWVQPPYFQPVGPTLANPSFASQTPTPLQRLSRVCIASEGGDLLHIATCPEGPTG